MEITNLKLELIDAPDERDRLEIDENYISELASSIHENGLLHPICVAKKGDRYQIVSGECRFLAFKKLGMSDIPCNIRDLDNRDILVIRATENLGRKDLSPIEEAVIYDRLYDGLGMTYADIGKKIGHSAGHVQRRIKLLGFDDSITKALHNGKMKVGVAEELMRIRDDARREYLTEMAIEHGITVAVARMWVEDYQKDLRGKGGDMGGGVSVLDVDETGVNYVSCNLCDGPMVLGTEKILRICPDCFRQLRQIKRNEGK